MITERSDSAPGRQADSNSVLSGLVELLDVARRASARVVDTLMTATYWDIVRRIVEHEQAGQKRGSYGEEVVVNLSKDLTQRFGRGFGPAQVTAIRQFHLTFPLPDSFSAPVLKISSAISTLVRGRPGLRRRLESYFWATSRRCQASKGFGVNKLEK